MSIIYIIYHLHFITTHIKLTYATLRCGTWRNLA